ncbi:hypothetical protein GY45DRAFT_702712 [Cubamyces sp. BRFM 1775]|nr:hypothetical protein GY45DRAFT_702712 [Cubamyces sp. BRFM 1775]
MARLRAVMIFGALPDTGSWTSGLAFSYEPGGPRHAGNCGQAADIAYSGVATSYPQPTQVVGVFNLCDCHTHSTLQPGSGRTANLQTVNLGSCPSISGSRMPRTVESTLRRRPLAGVLASGRRHA